MKERVVVAMSGGVDSSVAAALLLEQGYEVVGLTMRYPYGLKGIADARKVARALKVRHQVVDLSRQLQELVIDDFCAQYLRGRTPNPCIRCNQACRDLGWGEVRCTVNPDVGYEGISHPPMNLSGKIDIAGAGVKGLEAAHYASMMGLKVTLHEKRNSIGGQLLDITDPMKKKGFSGIIKYYDTVLQKKGVEIITGEPYEGDGIYCLPDVSYPDLEASGTVSIDSDIFKYHDLALSLAEAGEVEMSHRSLRSLDRTRRAEYLKMAEKLGIKFVDHAGRDFTISLMDRDQYDIRKAMISGRNAVLEYLRSRGEEYI